MDIIFQLVTSGNVDWSIVLLSFIQGCFGGAFKTIGMSIINEDYLIFGSSALSLGEKAVGFAMSMGGSWAFGAAGNRIDGNAGKDRQGGIAGILLATVGYYFQCEYLINSE